MAASAETDSRISVNSNQLQKSVHLSSFNNIFNNTVQSFAGKKVLFHLAGIGFTYVIIQQDIDYRVHRYFNKNKELDSWFIPAAITGFIGPFGVYAYLYYYGKSKSDVEMMGAGCAVLQSTIITILYVSLLKAITGRPNPDWESYDDMRKLSRTFNFGFGREGIFWGWPSGHTAATMAVVSTLTSYYPDKIWLKIGGYLYVVYTMVGVSAIGDGSMHWFSDAVAASFMAYAVGSTVGKYYRQSLSTNFSTKNITRFQILPISNADTRGLKIIYMF